MSENAFRSDIDKTLWNTAQYMLEHHELGQDGRYAHLALPSEEAGLFFVALFSAHDGRPIHLFNAPPQPDLSRNLDLSQTEERYDTFSIGDYKLRALTIPLRYDQPGADPTEPVAFLRIARYYDDFILFERVFFVLGVTGVGAVAFSLLIGGFLLRRMLKPLDDMAAVALRIHRANDLSRRLPDFGDSDEIGRLAMVLNQTLDRLESLRSAARCG